MRTILLSSLILAALLFPSLPGRTQPEVGNAVGLRAPDFALQNLDGTPVRLADQRGKAVALVFWNWACIECREVDLPELQRQVASVYGPSWVAVLAVDVDPRPNLERLRGFQEEKGITYPLLVEGVQTAFAYNVYTLPFTAVLDGAGVFRYRAHRQLEPAALEALAAAVEAVAAERLLDAPAPAFALDDQRGRTRSLGDARGKPLLLAFLALDAPALADEVAALTDVQAALGGRATVWAVGLGSVPPQSSFSLQGTDLSVLADDGGTARAYAAFDRPFTAVIDADGLLRGRFAGLAGDEARALLASLLE